MTATLTEPKAKEVKLNYTRPAQINRYAKQKEILDSPCRFVITEACTKSGKTTGCIVWLFEQALTGKDGDNCYWIAPVSDQSKIAYKRLKRYLRKSFFLFRDNKTEKLITLPNGVSIHFKSGDAPDSLYGDDVIAVVIDEASRCIDEVWTAVRSTLTATQGKCRIIGNVKGKKNWAYKLCRRAEKGELKNWHSIKITADDAIQAGTIKGDEVEEAKNTLPNGVFLELYYCIPNQLSSANFCYSFSKEKHVGKCPKVNKNYPVYLSFDFNYNPICCSVIQHYNSTIYVHELIKLQNSNIYTLCKAISTKYGNANYIVTGDATGASNSAIVQDNLNYYKIIQEKLRLSPTALKVPTKNPTLEENQVLVNGVLEHYKVVIDATGSQGLIYDCEFVEMGTDGKIKKDNRKDEAQQADSLDTFRYWLNVFMSDFIKRH